MHTRVRCTGDLKAAAAMNHASKRARSESSLTKPDEASAVMEFVLPLVATFFTQSEARALLAPLSKGARRAVARAQIVTMETHTRGFLEDVLSMITPKSIPTDEKTNNTEINTNDDEDILGLESDEDNSRGFDISSILHRMPAGHIWRPFSNAGQVLRMGISEQYDRVVILLAMSQNECAAAGLDVEKLDSLKRRDIVALPGLQSQSHGDIEELEWELNSVHVVKRCQDGSLLVALLSPADLGNVGSWKIKARGHFALGKLWAKHQTKNIIEGVTYGDDLMPQDLLADVNQEIDNLRTGNRPIRIDRYGANVSVYIAPHLPPFVRGVTPFVPSKDLASVPELLDEDGNPIEDRNGMPIVMPTYQWLPAYFDIDEHKNVSIRTDITGLRPASNYPKLYDGIARLFKIAIPRLEAVMAYSNHFRNCLGAAENRGIGGASISPVTSQLDRINLAGQSLQVMTKIVDYTLEPGEFYGTEWHVGCMFHERTVATCFFILDRDEGIDGGDVLFRRWFLETERQMLMQHFKDSDSQLRDMWKCAFCPLGKVATSDGRVFVLPTSHPLNVRPMVNTTNRTLRCRTMALFVVDPAHRIVSTQEVPDESLTMSEEECQEHARKLHNERRMYQRDLAVYQDYLSGFI